MLGNGGLLGPVFPILALPRVVGAGLEGKEGATDDKVPVSVARACPPKRAGAGYTAFRLAGLNTVN